MIVKAKENFGAVFGADCFLQYWPEIESSGIEVQKMGNYYYVMENGKRVNSSAFFSETELQNYLEIVSE